MQCLISSLSCISAPPPAPPTLSLSLSKENAGADCLSAFACMHTH